MPHSISGCLGGKAIELFGETSVRVAGSEAMASPEGKPRAMVPMLGRSPELPADLAQGPVHDVARAHGSGLAGHFPAVVEQDQRGNAANAEARSENRFFLGVGFGEAEARFQLARRFFERRRHHAAGTAPGCPEINQQRNIAACGKEVEIGCRESDGVAFEQALSTASAIGRIGEARRRQAVDGPAMGANNMRGFAHDLLTGLKSRTRSSDSGGL
ncbi:protein of unknown function [Methylocaldum szegediense]|uniref:Uncharacterized protein n=1 Tax=Methylocaldum szegediense TaxID=73780 RepID=A0ABM9HZK2_9GAMM|nr:protein of unknown function [Methylocaldum szegediense]